MCQQTGFAAVAWMPLLGMLVCRRKKTKNDDDENKEFLSAQEEEGRIKGYRDDCIIQFQMILVGSLSCQCCPSQHCGTLHVEVRFYPHFQLELIETLQQRVKFILAHKIWSVHQSIFLWKNVAHRLNDIRNHTLLLVLESGILEYYVSYFILGEIAI
jgi:hypothetical protein